MSNLRIQVFKITKEHNPNDTIIAITTDVLGINYVLIDTIEKYFSEKLANKNLKTTIPITLQKHLGGVGGLDPQSDWSGTNMPTMLSDNSVFTTVDGVMSLCPPLFEITKKELEIFCEKIFPSAVDREQTDELYAFREYLKFCSDIQTLKRGDFNIPVQQWLRLWYEVIKSSVDVPWLANFIQFLMETSHAEIFQKIADFAGEFHNNQINLQTLVTLIMTTYSFIKIDKTNMLTPTEKDTNFQIFSYKPPTSNPLNLLLNAQLSRISKTKQDERLINEERIEALEKIIAKNNYNAIHYSDPLCLPNASYNQPSTDPNQIANKNILKNIDFSLLFKYPNPTTLKFKENEKGIQMMNILSAYSLFFMEMANRELYNTNNTVCTIRLRQS